MWTLKSGPGRIWGGGVVRPVWPPGYGPGLLVSIVIFFLHFSNLEVSYIALCSVCCLIKSMHALPGLHYRSCIFTGTVHALQQCICVWQWPACKRGATGGTGDNVSYKSWKWRIWKSCYTTYARNLAALHCCDWVTELLRASLQSVYQCRYFQCMT